MDAFKNDKSEIKRVLHEIESKKQGLECEVLTIISPNGKILGEYQGTSHTVKVPEKDYSKCKGNILTHNHADNRTFTDIDIFFFINSGAEETRVSTDNGKYYSLEVKNKKLQKELWSAFQNDKVGFTQKIVHRLGRELDIATFVMTDEIRDLTAVDIDNWLEENANKYGCSYTKGTI